MMIRLIGDTLRRLLSFQGKHGSKVVWLVLAITAYGASGFLYFEQPARPDLGWSDGLWWALVTMTTVGYGDFFPETPGGRYIVGLPTMLIGVSILGYVLSVFAQSMLEAYSRERKGMASLNLQDHILIIHYPGEQRVLSVLEELRSDEKMRDAPVVLVDDTLDELPELLKDREVRFVHGDPAVGATLERANVKQARAAFVLSRDPLDPHSDNHCVVAALTLEQMNPHIHSVAECVLPERVELLKRAGVDSVVCIARISTGILVQEALDPGAQHVLREMVSNRVGSQIYMVEVKAKVRRAYAEAAKLLAQHELLAIGFMRDEEVSLNPEADAQVAAGDRIVALGRTRLAHIDLG